MTEAEFQRNVVELARLFGWRLAHFRPARTKHGWTTPMTGDPGYPDLTLVRRERLIFAELKSDKGKLTADQQAWLDELARTGCCEVYVWRPADIEAVGAVLK